MAPRRFADLAGAVGPGRQRAGIAAAVVGLPVLSAVLAAFRNDINFADELLIFLLAVIGVTIIGGIWPALLAAVFAGLLVNWYFTPPLHTFTVDKPDNLLALSLFVAVAVAVSVVVHIAARRAVIAARADALEAANRLRTALLAAVSHDLRTPLASIKASVTSLQQTDVSWSVEDRRALLATIDESADRLEHLIRNLLDMSRLQARSLEPFIRPTSVEEIAAVAMQSVDGGSRVQLHVPDDLPLVQADPGLLERVIANLIDNALRYSPADQPPQVVASAADDRVTLAVIDHGPGVPEHARDAMFAPFQRLGDHDRGTGLGLGLAVARGFMEAMGGQIEPSDTPGGGLTMTVCIDRAASTQSAPQHV